MKIKSVFAALCLLVFSGSFLFADTVFLKDGTQIHGKIISLEKNLVTILPDDNSPICLVDTITIKSIEYDDGRKIAIENKGNKEIFPYKEIFKTMIGEKPKEIVKTAEPEKKRIKSPYSHDGLNIGLMSGCCYGSAKIQSLKYYKYSGFGIPIGISIGYGNNDNLVLFAFYSINTIKAQKLKTDSKTVTEKPDKQIITFYHYGCGISYYILPYDFFFSLSAGSSYIKFINGTVKGTSSSTAFGSLNIGKEWRITENISIGCSVQGSLYPQSEIGNSRYTITIKNSLCGLTLQCSYRR